MRIIKALGKTLLFVAALYVFFRYAGDFSASQSAVLTAVAWLGYGLYEKLNLPSKAEDVFTPFCVSFYPKWYPLLLDFKLLSGKEDWKLLCDAENKIPETEFSVFRQGFSFTVIRPPSSEGLLPGLTFWNNHKTFLNDLELEAAIIERDEEDQPIGSEKKHRFFDHPSWASLPRIVFKWGAGGYEIGLEVQIDWWKKRCQSGELNELANLKQHTDHLCGTTRIVIATLPYSEFAVYYRSIEYAEQQKLQEESDKQLLANGWQRKAARDSEISDPWSSVEHKYFSVSHRSL
jgi:hypothetical protein